MKSPTVFLIASLVLLGCSTQGTAADNSSRQDDESQVRDVVSDFYRAYQNGDGPGYVDCLSEEALSGISNYVDELRKSPEENAEYLNSAGILLTADEVRNLTPGVFVGAIFSSTAYEAVLPDFSDAEIVDVSVSGDSAVVSVKAGGNVSEIQLLRGGDGWKITEGGVSLL